MKNLILGIFILLAQPIFGQVFTQEQKDFCIETFKKYLNVKEELIEERLATLKLVQSGQEDISEWYKNNIVHIDSVMNASIKLVKQDESIKLTELLERERYNIYAHPHNDTYLCYNFHSVLALIYSNTIKDDREYFTKLADLGEYSKMIIEAVQANWNEPHPLYLQVLEELKHIYEILDNQTKTNEILLLILKVEKSVK
jgi:hypothetical protein